MATRAPGNHYISSLSVIFRTQFRRLTSASKCFDDSVSDFERLVQTRCKSKDLSVPEALGYVNSLVKMKPMPSTWTLNHLLGSLSKMNRFSTVVSVYRNLTRLRAVDFEPDLSTLTVVIKSLCELGHVRLAFSVLATAIKLGTGYNLHTLCALLDGLCRRASMASAVELFERMEKNDVVYGTIINGYCRAGDTEKAVEILTQMEKPDAHCFGAIVDRLCRDDRVDEAVGLFRDMVASGVRPSFVSCNSVVAGLCRSGRRVQAGRLFAALLEAGVPPDLYAYNVLVESLCRSGESEAALVMFKDMVSRGVPPNLFSYNTLVVGLSKEGRWKEVAEVIKDMNSRRVPPNAVTFNAVVDARFKEGDAVSALQLVNVMAEKRLLPDIAALGPLCSDLPASGRSEESRALAESTAAAVAAGEKFSPDPRSLNIILNGLVGGFMMAEARKMFEEMVGRGEANEVSFTILINGYCLGGEVDEARAVFDRMGESGVEPNAITYNVMAGGYARVRRAGDALAIIKEMIVNGLPPDRGIRGVLRTVLDHRREDDEAKIGDVTAMI